MILSVKKIRFFFLKKQHAILSFIIAMLGIIPSCKVKYGSDPALFVLNGNIKSSSTNQPINMIKITNGNMVVRSDSTGNYTFRFENFENELAFLINFIDDDSTVHGSFKDKDTVISFGDASRNSFGEYTKNVDVRLDPK